MNAGTTEAIAEVPPQPRPDPDTEGFWEATAGGHLALGRCVDCRHWQHPPTERCRLCGGGITFEAVEGTGTLRSYIVLHRSSVPGLGNPPHVIAVIDLDNAPGARVTGLVRAEPSAVQVGARVNFEIVAIPGGPYSQPVFSLAG